MQPQDRFKHADRLTTDLDKLRLYRRGVDAFVVEEGLDLFGYSHVVTEIKAADVRRRDDTIARQLPDMKLVYRKYTFHLCKQQHSSTISIKPKCNSTFHDCHIANFLCNKPHKNIQQDTIFKMQVFNLHTRVVPQISLQNGTIPVILKLVKIQNIRFVGNSILNICRNFFHHDHYCDVIC